MKVLFFIYALNGGGAERVTATLASHWVSKGWDVTVVSLVASGSDAYELEPGVRRAILDLGAESGNIFAAIGHNLRRARALRNVILDTKPDIAIAMESRANILLPLAARGIAGLRIIGSERTYPPRSPLGSIWQQLRRRSYGKLDAVVALTQECADWLKRNTTASRVPVIPNPAGWPLAAHIPVVDPESTCRAGRKIVLAAGRLIREKNIEALISAFASASRRNPEWDLVIAGEGELRSVLENQVKAACLEDRVFFTGRVGNLGDWYQHADLYAMTSEYEGFPNTLAEAMAHGLPAVAFDCETGPRDIIRHGVDGFLVPPGDLEGLMRALEQIMADGGMRERFARRAVEARERFSLEKISALWEELFDACGSPAGSGVASLSKVSKASNATNVSNTGAYVEGIVHESRFK
jgi:glycosyltransferase involved in cell wall biosynthesis